MARGPITFEFFISGAPSREKQFSAVQKLEMRKVTESLSRHIEANNIENLVLVDRSARRAALALKNYWKNHPISKRPKIFFVNPLGGMTKEFMNKYPLLARQVIDQVENHMDYARFGMVEADTVKTGRPESDAQAKRKFKKMLPGLSSRANKKTLIFDTCLHTGSCMLATRHLLEVSGFKNLSYAVAARHIEDDSYHPEIVGLTEMVATTSCHPFGADSLVQKVLASPLSEKVTTRDINGTRRIRQSLLQRGEIPRIVE